MTKKTTTIDAGTRGDLESASRDCADLNSQSSLTSSSGPSRPDALVELALEAISAMEIEAREHLPTCDRLRAFILNPDGPDREWFCSLVPALRLRGWYSAFD